MLPTNYVVRNNFSLLWFNFYAILRYFWRFPLFSWVLQNQRSTSTHIFFFAIYKHIAWCYKYISKLRPKLNWNRITDQKCIMQNNLFELSVIYYNKIVKFCNFLENYLFIFRELYYRIWIYYLWFWKLH